MEDAGVRATRELATPSRQPTSTDLFPEPRIPMDYTLSLTDSADESLRKAIASPLVEYNASKAGPSNHRPIAVLLADSSHAVVGGLWGHTAHEWLFTQLLLVPLSLRGRGVGREIMRLAEHEASARGCRGAWLDTFEFQARGFYERLGYECFGELCNYPTGYSRYFMKKILAGPQE
jgi:GNAT superfamily N-acetyltransferase